MKIKIIDGLESSLIDLLPVIIHYAEYENEEFRDEVQSKKSKVIYVISDFYQTKMMRCYDYYKIVY